MSEPSKTLAARIAAVSAEIGAIKKGGHNSEQHFDFIEYAVVSGKLRTLFEKHGIAVVPQVLDYTVDQIQSKNGKLGYHYILKMHFTAINADDQADRIESDWLGEATDYGDKGINEAETSGLKYFLMRLLNISEKGDSEHEADAETPEAPVKVIRTAKRYGSGFRVDFDEIRERLDMLDDLESVKDYWDELTAQKPSEKQLASIKKIFSEKRESLGA